MIRLSQQWWARASCKQPPSHDPNKPRAEGLKRLQAFQEFLKEGCNGVALESKIKTRRLHEQERKQEGSYKQLACNTVITARTKHRYGFARHLHSVKCLSPLLLQLAKTWCQGPGLVCWNTSRGTWTRRLAILPECDAIRRGTLTK